MLLPSCEPELQLNSPCMPCRTSRNLYAIEVHLSITSMLLPSSHGVLRSSPIVARHAASVMLADDAFSAARWHNERRRAILRDHPEVRDLAESDFWVFSLGLAILPAYAWALTHAPGMDAPELCFHAWVTGSLRANWAVYCGHAISHNRWRRQVGPPGSATFNAAIVVANLGNAFQILPSYWLLHQSHHTKLGTQSLHEARSRAKQGRQADGDLAIATRLFSPPSHKYALRADDGGSSDSDDAGAGGAGGGGVAVLPRQNELVHQSLSVAVHALAPLSFAGYLYAALRADERHADATLRRGLAVQAAASLAGYGAVAALSVALGSAAPLGLYLASSAVWLSPLNLNWLWTSVRHSSPAPREPTRCPLYPALACGTCVIVSVLSAPLARSSLTCATRTPSQSSQPSPSTRPTRRSAASPTRTWGGRTTTSSTTTSPRCPCTTCQSFARSRPSTTRLSSTCPSASRPGASFSSGIAIRTRVRS